MQAEPAPAYKQYTKQDPKGSNIFFGGGGSSGAPEKQASLFSDNFVTDYRHFNKGKQENLMNLPNIFPPQASAPHSRGSASSASGTGETERERRLRLREIERKKRLEGISGGGYGAVDGGPASSS